MTKIPRDPPSPPKILMYNPDIEGRGDPDGRVYDAALVAVLDHLCGVDEEDRGNPFCIRHAGCEYCWNPTGGYWYVTKCIWD